MTDVQLNIAICEWRGWKITKRNGVWPDLYDFIDPEGLAYSYAPLDFLPSHITSIAALGNMHEAEKGLTEGQKENYLRELQDSFSFSIHYPTPAICATARQRATALLRVVKPELFE